MAEAEKVVIEIVARVDNFDAKIRGSATAFGGSMARIQSSAERAERAIAASVSRIALAFSGFVGARGAVQLIDSFKSIEAQLKLATATTGSFAQAQEDVQRIATSTRSSLEATAGLYATFARSAGELGINQEQVARITQTVTEGFKVSGASAAEASGAIRQLSQAFASGVLRGDEFNSIMESAPRLSRLLAESLGVTVGSLRAMAEAGELSADKLVRAFSDKKFTAALDEEFKQMPVTFGDAMEQITTAATLTFGAFDRGGEFSKALAGFVTDGADGFADMEQAAENFGIAVRGELAGIAAAFAPVTQGARDLLQLMQQISSLGGEAQGSKSFLRGSADDFYRWAPDSVIGRAAKRFIDADNATTGKLALDKVMRGDPFADFPQFRPGSIRRPPAISGGGRKSGNGKSAADKAEAEARKAERERLDAMRDQADFERQVARLTEDILAAKAAMQTASEDVLAYELGKIDRERDQANKELATDVELGRLKADRAETLKGLNNDLAEQAKAVSRQRAAQRERENNLTLAQGLLDNNLELLRGDEALAETQKERRELALAILDAEAEKLRLTLEDVLASETATEAQKEIARRRLAQLDQEQANAREGVRRDTAGPLESYIGDIEKTAADLDGALENVGVDALKAVNEGLVDAIVNFRSLGDVARAVLQQILAQLLQIVIQMLIMKAIKALFGGFADGGLVSTGQGGAVPGLTAGGFATGGPVFGAGTATSDSIPAMLSDGEFVIRKRAVDGLGLAALNHMNRTGRLPGEYADGGLVRAVSPSNAPAHAPGGPMGRVGMDDDFKRELRGALAEAATAMPPVNLYPTLDPKHAMERMLSDPGAQRLLFGFLSDNSRRANSSLSR